MRINLKAVDVYLHYVPFRDVLCCVSYSIVGGVFGHQLIISTYLT